MTQVFPSARLLQPAQARLLPFVVELLLTPPKVPRRAVRILVVTVRSGTARRRMTAPRVAGTGPLPALTGAGRSSILDRGESSSLSVTQLAGAENVRTEAEGLTTSLGLSREGRSALGYVQGRGRGRSVLHDCRLCGGSATPRAAGAGTTAGPGL